MKEKDKAPWFVRILSLFFAILLYYNANSITQDVVSNQPVFNELEAVSENVPINVTYNQDKYFISGYEQTVDVEMKSPNKILLDKESNSETRSFSVIMDLTKYKEGTFEVPLEVVGMPGSIKAKIKPNKLHVIIEKKENNSFKVEPAIDSNIFANGYEMKQASVEPSNVTLSAGTDTLKQVDRVIAGVSDKKDVTNDFSQKVKVYAINAKGEPLSVHIEPDAVKVNVEVDAPTKKVKINPIQAGLIPNGIKDYAFSVKDEEVTIQGPKDTLDEISKIDLKIDTSNIRETVSSSYVVVVPKDIKVIPDSVFITVIPEKAQQTNSGSSSTKKGKSTTTTKSDKLSESTTNSVKEESVDSE
ncbi:MAG: CdaR family protein [Vagococcus sp.]